MSEEVLEEPREATLLFYHLVVYPGKEIMTMILIKLFVCFKFELISWTFFLIKSILHLFRLSLGLNVYILSLFSHSSFMTMK